MYWDDETDAYNEKEGTLLPLWEFKTDKTRDLEVTGISWNPTYKDLFAVSFGSCKHLYLIQVINNKMYIWKIIKKLLYY